MNYRHAFHAGNFADVVKHAVLARILVHLSAKEAPWRMIDTHAGVGLYDLAADEALRTGEWRGGIGRILAEPLPAVLEDLLESYLRAVRAANGGGDVLLYPGSPGVATALGRLQDRFVFNELHPEDADTLAAVFAGDRRVRIGREDGYVAVKSQLPPPERRGVTLIDPPFETAGEFDRLARAFVEAARRFATGVVVAWYPLKALESVGKFHADLRRSGLARLLVIEQWTRRPGSDGPLAGAGLVVMNPPYRLAESFAEAMPALADRLAEGPGAGGRVDWLAGERTGGA
jgi:23S rRNA (adenine2030-N6)-methyltransferase